MYMKKRRIQLMMVGNIDTANHVKERSQQRFPVPGEPVCVVCGKYGEYICNETDDDSKGGIFTTMNAKVIEDFCFYSANIPYIWHSLESTFGNPLETNEGYAEDSVGFIFRTGSTRDIPEIENIDSILYEAAVNGCWWKAKSILKIHRNAATEVIHPNGNMILHVAIEMGNNYLVEKLLEF
ncbi:putative RNA helicase [Helianthus debilis subsp. tardiflorus]